MAAQGSESGISTVVAIVLGVIGLAIVALIVSQNAATGSVTTAGGSAIANLIRCALSPVTGGTCAGTSAVKTAVSSTINYGNPL